MKKVRIQGWFWIGWLLCFSPITGLAQSAMARAGFEHFSGLNGLSEETVTVIYQDQRGFLWVGTQNGLNRYDGARFKAFHHAPFDSTSLSGNHITALWEDQYGMLWVGTREGLNRYNPRLGTFTRFPCDPKDRNARRSEAVTAITGLFSHKNAGSQIIWVGTESGLSRLEINTPSGQHPAAVVRPVAVEKAPFAGQPVRHLVVDGTGRLWVSTADALYHTVDPCTPDQQPVFSEVSRSDLSFDRTMSSRHCAFRLDSLKTLWIISGKAITRAAATGTTHFQFQSFLLPEGSELSNPDLVSLDRSGKIFLLDDKGQLLAFNGQTGVFEAPGKQYGRLAGLVGCTSLFCDRSRNLWFGTKGSGLYKYHLRNELFHNSADPAREQMVSKVHSLHFGRGVIDENGRLWYPKEEGLACIDPATGATTIYRHNPLDPNSLSRDHVTVVLADPVTPERILWVGTRGGGLNRLDRKTNQFTHYVEKHGLSNGTINGILPDEQGHLWISTPQGISRVYLNRERLMIRIQNYGRQHGLPDRLFYDSAAFKTKDGHLCFGGANGWVWFHPDSVTDNLPSPPVVITDFRIHHQPVNHLDPDAPLHQPVSETGEITLSHDQNTIGFTFAALDYAAPAKNRYAYFLENFDAGWNEAGINPEAVYTGLSPGRYTLRVRACNADGVWNEEGTELMIIIRAPWWQTWWAYLLFFSLAVGLFWSLARSANRQRRLRQEADLERARADEKQRQAENLEAQARRLSDAFLALKEKNEEVIAIQQKLIAQDKLATLGQLIAGIAHEIKTPLNFVINFSDIAAEQAAELTDALEDIQAEISPVIYENLCQLAADIRENTLDSRDNGQRALSLMHHLLNLSRGSEDRFYTVDLHALLDENAKLAYHGFRAIAPGFKITMEKTYDPAIGPIEAIPADLGRVLLNLLNNAFEAVHQKQQAVGDGYDPVLYIRTELEPSGVQIRIRDNGAGIPAEVQDRIFQPFFTTKPYGSGNAGLGLSISRDIIVQKHGGKLEVSSRSGEFTEFRIFLPARSAGSYPTA